MNPNCTFFTYIGVGACAPQWCYMGRGSPTGFGRTGCGHPWDRDGDGEPDNYVTKFRSDITSVPSVANAGGATTGAPPTTIGFERLTRFTPWPISEPPTPIPSPTPTEPPTHTPTGTPTEEPTTLPPTTTEPSFNPTQTPTESPTSMPTITPTEAPSTLPPTQRPANCQQCYIPYGNSQCVECSDDVTPCIGCTENLHSWHCPTNRPGCIGKICMDTP